MGYQTGQIVLNYLADTVFADSEREGWRGRTQILPPRDMTGREKCDRLKAIRKALADKMGMDLHQTVCTYDGECRGTCPKCKQEESILNAAILHRGTAVASATLLATALAACTPSGGIVSGPGGNDKDGGNDLSGDVAYVEDDGTDDRSGTADAKGDGDDDVVELTGEVAEPTDDGDCDDKVGKKDDVEDIEDIELSGDVATNDMD